MRIDVITLFPRMFEGVISQSILRIAREKGLVEIHLTDLRDFTFDKHRSVDDRPFGGGPGMVLKVDPVVRAVREVQARGPEGPGHLCLMCPRGGLFDQEKARELAGYERLVFLAPHYEGYDERIAEILAPESLSAGDYVLTGGELPALMVIDAVVRLIPGVLGDPESGEVESFSPGNEGLLGFPQYTRPAEYEGKGVPEVLISGDHAKVAAWRSERARERTQRSRPDLWEKWERRSHGQEKSDGGRRGSAAQD